MINTTVQLEIPGRLLLLPYLPVHVPQYHAWMSRPELLEATESEPLTLAEEEENQASWLQSLDKLTFIIYAPREAPTPSQQEQQAAHEDVASLASTIIKRHVDTVDYADASGHALCRHYEPNTARNMFTAADVPVAEGGDRAAAPLVVGPEIEKDDRTYVMIGDCNLFLLPDSDDDDDDDEEEEDTTRTARRNKRVFEVEVMIAETSFRRRGCAEGASRLLMQYATCVLDATAFVAKILEENAKSITLFTEKLHFGEVKRVKVFHEIHYCRALFPTKPEEKGNADDEEELGGAYRNWAHECLQYSGGKAFLCSPLKETTV